MSEAQQGGNAGVDSRRLANEALRCIRLLRKEIKENVVPTPYEALHDCYAADYTQQAVQRLQDRAADLRGQRARLDAEVQEAQAAAADAVAVQRAAGVRLQRAKQRCDALREEKGELVAALQEAMAAADATEQDLRDARPPA